jgi:hypothetical protein
MGSIVGGSMHSVEEGMVVAAAAAIRILNGEKAGDMKVPPSRFKLPRFDWRQMQRFGISDSNLPPGSTVYFREPTVWERYSWQIALITAVILVQAGLILALLHEHSRRKFSEVQAPQRMATEDCTRPMSLRQFISCNVGAFHRGHCERLRRIRAPAMPAACLSL